MIKSANEEMKKDIRDMAEKCRRLAYKYKEMARVVDELEREFSYEVGK